MDLTSLTDAVIRGQHEAARELTTAAIETGLPPDTILAALTQAMDFIGRRFRANEIFVPEVLMAARAMKQAMALLEPALAGAGVKPIGNVVIGTVAGDLHDIGKNLVSMMWKGANVNVIDLGVNVQAHRFVDAAREHQARLIGVSALLTTTMPAMTQVVQAVKQADLNGVKVMIGGAPVTEAFAIQIGADDYAPDAATAVEKLKQLLNA